MGLSTVSQNLNAIWQDYLKHLAFAMRNLNITADQLLVGTHGQYTPAIGAALHYINRFVHEGTAL